MAARWILRGYRVNNKKLWGLVGTNKPALARKLVATAKRDGVDRAGLRIPIEQLVDEVLSGSLDRAHATAYRVLLPAAADVAAKRISFPLRGARGYKGLETRAPRDKVAKALTSIGMTGFARGWKKACCPWPWLGREPKVKWPMAALWSPAEVLFNLREASAVTSFDIKGDQDGALADVATTLAAFAKGAKGQSLMIVVDGDA